jgi:hypothetical protein
MLVPVALETLANQTIKSASVKGADINAGIVNPIQNFAEVIAEPRLDEADAKAWYLAAAKGTDTIEVAYLNGVDTPYIDQQEGSPLMVSPRKCVLMPVWRRWTIAA